LRFALSLYKAQQPYYALSKIRKIQKRKTQNMTENTKNEEKPIDSKDQQLNYKTLIEKVTADLVILGMKDTCKTTLLKHLARELMKDESNHVIIIETFPQFIHSFDKIPYMVITDKDIQPKENKAYLEENKSYIQWSKDYDILNESEILEFLKTNKDCLILITCEDMESITAVMSFLIYVIYRKQYQRAYYERLDRIKENFWFLIEESHNLLDSTTVQKKTFQKLRKEQNEFRNLKMHMVCVAIRLQDLNPKIRSKMSLILSRISLDDYQLKVRNLLRNSKYRDLITELPKGTFVFPELDLKLKTEPFKQEGKPYLWHRPEQPTQQPKKYPSLLKAFFIALTGQTQNYKRKHPELYPATETEQQKQEEDLGEEDSQGDALMTLGDDDVLFPEEF
jgi:hypothetical protein